MTTMQIDFDTKSVADYRMFKAIRRLPRYGFRGWTAIVPDEYADVLGRKPMTSAAVDDLRLHPDLFDYQRDIAKIAIRKRKFAAFVDCVTADTTIDGPDGQTTVRDAVAAGVPFRVWSIDRDGRTVAAFATPPWVAGRRDVYRIATDVESMTATAGHRVLTPDGWRRVDELRIGELLAVFASTRRATNSEPAREASLAGAMRSSRTTQDSTGSCSSSRRPCGAPPRSAAGNDQERTPSQADVREPDRSPMRWGGSADARTHTRPHQRTAPLSTTGYGFLDATTAEDDEFQTPACGSERSDVSIRTAMRSLSDTRLSRQACEPHPSEDPQIEGDPYPHPFWTAVTAVDYIGNEDVFDVCVPRHENYSANGIVSHNCGLGKTLILLEFARHADRVTRRPVVVVSPLNVCKQTVGEAAKWYGASLPILRGADAVESFLRTGSGIAVTNFEGLPEDYQGPPPGAVIIDESSILKSHYGKHGQQIIALGRGVEYKLCCTGTPAPNDRIEYANHAVFLDQARTPNEFLARYFVNRGETGERWELKPHSLHRFYRDLSSWCIFLSHPATYGWKDNAGGQPPINVHIHEIDLTAQQRQIMQTETGNLIMTGIGGIGSRTKMARLAKGDHNGTAIPSHKFDAVVNLVNSWPDESVIVWCLYNAEQDRLAKLMPDAANIAGDTTIETRERLIEEFQSGKRRVLISKPKILGFGLNLQIATRQVFSSLQDSYEQYYQAVKRSNRVGSTRPLNVHIPITQIEAPMVSTVLDKAGRVEADTREQEALFRKEGWQWLTR